MCEESCAGGSLARQDGTRLHRCGASSHALVDRSYRADLSGISDGDRLVVCCPHSTSFATLTWLLAAALSPRGVVHVCPARSAVHRGSAAGGSISSAANTLCSATVPAAHCAVSDELCAACLSLMISYWMARQIKSLL